MFVKLVAPLLAVFLAVESAGIVGAPVDADINSPEVQQALQFAVAQYNAGSSSTYISQVVKVIKAQVQVVSGWKYIFTVKMAKTCCKKGETKKTCTINPDPAIAQAKSSPHFCHFPQAPCMQPYSMESALVEQHDTN